MRTCGPVSFDHSPNPEGRRLLGQHVESNRSGRIGGNTRCIWYGTRRHAHNRRPGGNITQYDGTGTDHSLRPNADPLNDGRADADVGLLADAHISRQRHPGRHVDVSADEAIMIDGRTGVHDCIRSDFHSRLEDRTREYLHARAEGDQLVHDRVGMNDRKKCVPVPAKRVEKSAAGRRAADGAEAVDQQDARGLESTDDVVPPEMSQPADPITSTRRIREPDDLRLPLLDDAP